MYKVGKIGNIIGSSSMKARKADWVMFDSELWKIWKTALSMTVCSECAQMNGKIFSIHDQIADKIPVHPNCKCKLEVMTGIVAGPAASEIDGIKELFLDLEREEREVTVEFIERITGDNSNYLI